MMFAQKKPSSSGIVLIFGLDFRVLLYTFATTSTSPSAVSQSSSLTPGYEPVSMTKLTQVSVENYVLRCRRLLQSFLRRQTHNDDATSRKPVRNRGEGRGGCSVEDVPQSLLLNICGKSPLFQSYEDPESSNAATLEDAASAVPFTFMAVSLSLSLSLSLSPSLRKNQKLRKN